MVGIGFLTRIIVYGAMFAILLAALYLFFFIVVKGIRYFVAQIKHDTSYEIGEWRDILPKRRKRKTRRAKKEAENEPLHNRPID